MNTYGVNDLVASVDAVADEAVDVLLTGYADAYELAPEPRRGSRAA